jgi:protein-S-isoprenylcysteine O-methyltransferase Ste14
MTNTPTPERARRWLTGASAGDVHLRREGGSRMQTKGSARTRKVGWMLVAAQFGLIGVCLLPLGPAIGSGQLRPLGVVLLGLAAVVGGLALLAMGRDMQVHPVPGASVPLHTHGIYAFIRHPMYAAVLLACAGVALSSGRILAIAAVLLLAVVLSVKARFEDRLLMARFGWQFAVYAGRVPAIIPQPWRSHAR